MKASRATISMLVLLPLLTSGRVSASNDPVSADPNNGANFNRYAYVNNNPYKFIDPDGRDAFLFTDRDILVIPVHFTGSAATPANIAQIRARVETATPDFGGMRTVLQVLDAPGGVGTNIMNLSPGFDFSLFPNAGEGVISIGGNFGHINSSSTDWIGAGAHDIFHFAGAPDGYRSSGTRDTRTAENAPGYTNNHIMGASRSGSQLNVLDVDGIRSNDSTRQLNLGGFQGTFRVDGRIDSMRLDKAQSK